MTIEYRVYPDGDAWCAVGSGFINLQESLSGFGSSPCEALADLLKHEDLAENNRCAGMRKWKCNCCHTVFSKGSVPKGQSAPCPYCTAGGQYVYEVREEPS